MRRLSRRSLPDRAAQYLREKQAAVAGGAPARSTWENARPTKAMGLVEGTLKGMVGKRARCMYCEDSRGTDIDHFWPMSRYRDRTFVWENLLWSCTDCNRHKLARFVVDEHGLPLLIDPTADDPWDYLFYDTRTGNITARFHVRPAMEDVRGKETVDSLPPLGNEAVVEGRLRTYRNIRKAVRTFLDQAPKDPAEARADLLESIRDNDDYGLVSWYFLRDGRDEPPFKDLRQRHRDVWEEIENLARPG